ncbi:MAG TPA: response regulator transcription factor [Terriglobales bacterium]|nr:response regulator transcription factor [Terriglobales bacterium]
MLVADSVSMSCHLLADALERSALYSALAAATPKKVLQLLEKDRFDVLLLGSAFSTDPMESIRFVSQLRTAHPAVGVVVLLDTMDRNLVVEAFRSGARGVFSRSESFEALCKCIRCVHEGQVWASSVGLHFVLEALVEHGPIVSRLPGTRPLSKREEQITVLVAEGYSNREISERLALSEHTIKNYLFRVFEKLGVTTRVGLTLYALKQGKAARTKMESVKRPPMAESRLVTKNQQFPS